MTSSTLGALPPKVFFRIGEVSGLVGVEPHVLRYWEREFRSIRPSKSAKGQRVYSRKDVENLLRVKDLLYAQGFTIAGARRRLKGVAEPDPPPETADVPVSREAARSGVFPGGTSAEAGEVEEPLVRSRTPGRVKEQLAAVRAEVQAFLDELGG